MTVGIGILWSPPRWWNPPMSAAALPADIEALHAIIAAQADDLAAARAGLLAKALEIEKLKVQLARLRRLRFGRSSEKLARATEQLELMLEEAEASAAPPPPISTNLATRPREVRPTDCHLRQVPRSADPLR